MNNLSPDQVKVLLSVSGAILFIVAVRIGCAEWWRRWYRSYYPEGLTQEERDDLRLQRSATRGRRTGI